MLIVAALLAVVIFFLFCIKPVFIALVLGVLVTIVLDKIVSAFCKATESCSPAKQKLIALISVVAIILIVIFLLVIGLLSLLTNFNAALLSLEDLKNFSTQYDEIAEDMVEDIKNVSLEGNEYIENILVSDPNSTVLNASDPPPAGIFDFLSTKALFQSALISGGGIIDSTTEKISFFITTLFACCLIIPIMAGYYFKEKGKIRGKFVTMVPDKYRDGVDETTKNIANDMGTFTITKILEAAIIMFLYCAGFYVAGLPHWFFAGITIGLFNIVPYVGFVLPAIPIVVYAYTQGTEIMFAVIGIMAIIQLFDYFVILPNMVMRTVKVSPLTAVILTLAGLKLAGVFGLIFAVPLYIFCKIILIACYKMLVTIYPDPADPNENPPEDG